MQAYVLRRLLALIPTLFFASVIVFVTVRLIPGDVIDLMLSQNDIAADKLSRDQLISALGLDKPMWEQYGRWASAILFHGDFGQSLWQSTSVRELLFARLPVTFELGLIALIIAVTIAVPIGVYSAIRQDTAGDYLFRSISFLMLAVPAFWTGTMVMVLPSIWWGWSPEVKYVYFTENPLQNLKQMLIPAFILGTALSAITMRLTRTQMLEVLRQDYIRTAWAKGTQCPHRDGAPRAAQRAGPGRDAGRLAGAAADRRCRHRGTDLRHSRDGIAAARCREPARLSDHHRRVPDRRRRRDVHQSRRRPELWPARSAREVPLMAIAEAALRPAIRQHGAVSVFLLRLLREKPLGAVCGAIFMLFLFCGVFADLLAPYGMNQINPINRLKAPSWQFPFGTDNLGRDMLSRCLYGAQLSVIIGFCAAGLATFVSIVLGIVTGYIGGKLDLITQRFVDAWMSFPDLIILIVVVAVVGPGMPQIIVTLGLLLGIGGSRIIRSAVVSVRENMYVHAAQSIGASTGRILWRHILPNVMPPIIVLFTTRVGTVILAESGLSFLGLGVPPPAPTWGGMLSGTGRTYMFQGPWLALAPGLCLTVVVFTTNVFGDALRDLLDPRMRGSR